MKIRPRIFLEGNFFVDLKPGTPAAPTLDDGDTIPITQTSTPVQLDQILTALQRTRARTCRSCSTGSATALTRQAVGGRRPPTSDPTRAARSAAESLNDAIDYGEPALRARRSSTRRCSAPSATTCRGSSRLARTTEALGRNEGQLQGLVTNFNRTLARSPTSEANLRPTIRELGRRSRAPTGRWPRSTPRSRTRARSPARSCPASARRRPRWRRRSRGSSRWPLLSPGRAGRPGQGAAAGHGALGAAADEPALFARPTCSSRCVTENLLPTGDIKIDDGPRASAGTENSKEFWHAMAGLAGEGQNFDGNGQYVRFQPGGGNNFDRTSTGGPLFGSGARRSERGRASARPTPDAPATEALPNVNAPRPPDVAKPTPGQPAPSGRRAPAPADALGGSERLNPPRRVAARGGRPMKRAISKYRRSSLAIIGLLVIALVVGGYILTKQRLTLPAGCRARHGLLEVQGRVLDRPGRHAGPGPDGADRRRRRGRADEGRARGRARAIVSDEGRPDPPHLPRRDAAAAARRPASTTWSCRSTRATKAGRGARGLHDPGRQNTLPDVKLDEILGGARRATRATTCSCCSAAAARRPARTTAGDSQHAPALRAAAHRARASPSSSWSARGTSSARSTTSACWPRRSARRTTTWRSFVDSTTRCSARSPARTRALRETLQRAAADAATTNSALGKVEPLARVLGPTLEDLRPAARALGPTLRQTRPFLRESTPIIRDQLRPVRPRGPAGGQGLRPSGQGLSEGHAGPEHVAQRRQRPRQRAGLQPAGRPRRATSSGALGNHLGNSIFNMQDAHGPIRRGVIVISCTAARA